MSVHAKEFYGQIRSLLNIPDYEPIFILRGQDELALPTIEEYESHASDAGCGPKFLYDLMQVRDEFKNFAHLHKQRMKTPD